MKISNPKTQFPGRFSFSFFFLPFFFSFYPPSLHSSAEPCPASSLRVSPTLNPDDSDGVQKQQARKK